MRVPMERGYLHAPRDTQKHDWKALFSEALVDSFLRVPSAIGFRCLNCKVALFNY